MATIKGVWLFNDVVNTHLEWLNEYQIENVIFTSNGVRFTDIYWNGIDDEDFNTVYHIYYADTLAVAGYYGNLSNWENEAYKTVDFGTTEQEVSAEFLAWMQENATQQASGETTAPTAESVKANIQSLITASNAKTGKTDANLTDAVKTLLEGYGQGGESDGGDNSGDCPVKIVDELPAVGVEGEIYCVSENALTDVAIVGEGQVESMGSMTPIDGVIATSETFPTIKPVNNMICYVTDTPEIYIYFSSWYPLSAIGMGGFLGEITNIGEADTTANGYYAVVGIVHTLYKYSNGQYKQLFTKGGCKFTSNGDGTCKVTGIEPNYDINLVIPSVSPDGDTVTSIDDAFRDDGDESKYAFTSVTIPDTVTLIDTRAFNGVTLKTITIPASVKTIEMHAFEKSTLGTVTISDGVTDMKGSCFNMCRNLVSITIPDSVTNLGDWAFEQCTSLEKATLSKNITKIPQGVFWGCTALTNITFNGTIEQWNALTKGNSWRAKVPATGVTCSDGTVTF